MNINLRLSGVTEQIIEDMIRKGYAATKTEAIRMAILDYSHHHLAGKESNEMTNEDIADLDAAVKEYKTRKTVALEEI